VCAIERCFLLGLVLLLCALPSFPQQDRVPAKQDNLYSAALFASTAEMEKTWGHIDDSYVGGRIRTDYRHMLVEKDPEITDGIPSQLEDFRVEYLDNRDLINRCRKVRRGFSILTIHPIQNDGGRLKIRVSVAWAKYEKGKLILGFSDWSDVEFRFDCEMQKFVISGVKLGGI
jgi:hypothetical protein